MSLSKRAAQYLLPQLTRGFRSSGAVRGAESPLPNKNITHDHIAHGDGYHGVRPGYTYDWEHGPHYIDVSKIPNFERKWAIGMPIVFAVGFIIPAFAVWWQQSKLKTS